MGRKRDLAIGFILGTWHQAPTAHRGVTYHPTQVLLSHLAEQVSRQLGSSSVGKPEFLELADHDIHRGTGGPIFPGNWINLTPVLSMIR